VTKKGNIDHRRGRGQGVKGGGWSNTDHSKKNKEIERYGRTNTTLKKRNLTFERKSAINPDGAFKFVTTGYPKANEQPGMVDLERKSEVKRTSKEGKGGSTEWFGQKKSKGEEKK